MGRRAVSTTKTGKFMNPTDRSRKEARKKELRKNKKQRLLVRTTVLKAREPAEILTELEHYDQMECLMPDETLNGEARLSDRVIQEKRRKLLETFDRIVGLFKREEPEQASILLQQRQEYEQKRHKMLLRYEQIKATEKVDACDIPLPSLPPALPGAMISRPGFPSVPTPGDAFRPGILKRGPAIPKPNREPPGPPPGPPTDLSDGEEESAAKSRIRFATEEPAPPGEEPLSTLPKSVPFGGPPRIPGPAPMRPPIHMPHRFAPIQPHQQARPTRAPTSETVVPNVTLKKGQTSISARPQLKNLIGDATKLIPVALRVKRHGIADKKSGIFARSSGIHGGLVPNRAPQQQQQNKEDAYSQFMQEMQGLI